MVHTVALFFLLHPSLSFLCLVFFPPHLPRPARLGDRQRQQLALASVFKANTAANRELQVRQTRKQELITHFQQGRGPSPVTGGSPSDLSGVM